ncbi:MAG TPA: hypothetical protein DCS87_07535 [Rheinheimera sp.]|nr:hypothetical protein [Rheinheimera sp.]
MEFLRDGTIPANVFIYGIFCLGISVVCALLAKDKGRNTLIAAITGLVPGLNYLALAYYIGVSKK